MRNEKSWIVAGLSLAAAMMTLAGCQTAPKDERSSGLALDDKHTTERVKKSLESCRVTFKTGILCASKTGKVQKTG